MIGIILGVVALFLIYLAIGYLGSRLNERRPNRRKASR